MTTDVFRAIAEPRRRELINALRGGRPRAVGELVGELRWRQPTVSKHLRVLHKAGIVTMSRHGRRRLYRLHANALRPVYEWARTFERLWTHQLDRIKAKAEQRALEMRAGNRRSGKDEPPEPTR